MGYCPRCGENSAFGQGGPDSAEMKTALRIPVNSRIVHLSATENGSVISYGGTRFRISRQGDDYLLVPLE